MAASAQRSLRPRHDLPASLVVFLVAVPLSLGIAVASGAPLMAGLIAAVVGGLVAGLCGGTPLQVSGPDAGLTVIVAGLVDQFGWRATCALTVAAGLVQIVLGAGRGPRGSPVDDLATLPGQLTRVHDSTALVGLGVIAVLLVWPRLPAGVRVVPGPLAAVVLLTLVTRVPAPPVARIDLPGSLAGAVQLPRLPERASVAAVMVGVLTLAVVASLESLMSAVAVDKLRPGGRRSDLDRELALAPRSSR